jgi:hypothetical protein
VSTAQDAKGTVYLFWDQNPGINYIATNTSNIAKGFWPAQVAYTNGGVNFSPSIVALKNGTLLMLYASQRAGKWSIYVSRYNNGVWAPEARLTNGLTDQNPTSTVDSTGKIWAGWTRTEGGDLKLGFIDTKHKGYWVPGDAIAYDSNGNGVYDSGEPVIYGPTPALGTPISIDPKIKFIDTNGDGTWETGEFVVYDPSLNGVYDPRIKFIDSNGDNVWDVGEPIAFDPDSDGIYTSHTGVSTCTGTSPTQDCMIAGPVPTNGTLLKTDPILKFVDSNGDGVWEPGKTIVSDRNNDNQFDANDPAIAALVGDSKLKFAGPGSTWSVNNTVVYDVRGLGTYDSKIKFVDLNHDNHWDPGDPVALDPDFNGIYDYSDTPIVDPNYPNYIGQTLKNDPHLKFVDCFSGGVVCNNNGAWDPGEPVVYDSNLNNVYDGKLKFVNATNNPSETWSLGKAVVYDTDNNGIFTQGKYHNDTVIAGTPANNTRLRIDPNIEFIDRFGNMSYAFGEPVVYDSDRNNVYDLTDTVINGTAPSVGTGLTTGIGETVVAPGAPPIAALLKIDPKVKYVENNGDNVWDPNEDMIYDQNNNGTYVKGDPIIYSNGTLPAPGVVLRTDSAIRFYDSNNNNVTDSSEAVIYDGDLNGIYDTGEYLIRGTTPQSGTPLTITGEPVIAGPTPPIGTVLKSDPKIKFVDQNANGHWDQGEPVEYDTNNNGVFDVGIDVVIFGNPIPALGTPLVIDASTLAGVTMSTGTPLFVDQKIMYWNSTGMSHWVPGESVIYESAGVGKYVTGRFHNDTVISGAPPPNMTALTKDSLIKYERINGGTNWENGESVAYDSNNNNQYDQGEPVVAAFQYQPADAVLQTDSHIKYFETGGDTHWDIGEAIVYHSGTNSSFSRGDLVIAGPRPALNSTLANDPNIMYVDSNVDGHWDPGEAVVYKNFSLCNACTYPIASGGPEGGNPEQTVTHLFYKTYLNGVWSSDTRLTSQPTNDHAGALGQTEDGRIWMTYAGDRGGPAEVLYKTTRDGTTWTPEVLVATPSPLDDKEPAMVQDRNGTIWIVFSRSLPCGCTDVIETDLYYVHSLDNGVTWLPGNRQATALTSTLSADEIYPNLAQLSDKKLYVFYTYLLCSSNTCTANLEYMNTLISPIHDARLNNFSVQATNLRIGQTLSFMTNVTNVGDINDTLTVNINLNGTMVTSNSTLVKTGQTVQIPINWVTGGIAPGRYVISATLVDNGESLPNQIYNTAALPGSILIRPAGDVNGDCKVNIFDLSIVGAAFGTSVGQPNWNIQADLDGDGKITIVDLTIVGGTFGQSIPSSWCY